MVDLVDYKKLKAEFDEAVRPMYFFHDDPDGLCSFLLAYDYVKEGVGIPVKSQPVVDSKFLNKVKYYDPDMIFVLDVCHMTQDFVDEVKRKVVWVDHHDSDNLHKVKLYNPRLKKPTVYLPVTAICYKALGGLDWVMMVGCVGDHYLPPETKKFVKKYPNLLTVEESKDIEKTKYDSRLGLLVRIFSFILKPDVVQVKRTVKVLTRIKDPEEILSQTTSNGKYVWKQYKKINKVFMTLWDSASKLKAKDGLVVYIHSLVEKMSFTSDISSLLSYKFKDELVIVAREVDDEIHGSLRYRRGNLKKILPKVLKGLNGRGGGHEAASGFLVKKRDFEQFLENLKKCM